MTVKEIIDGLKMTMDLITFDPSTGEDIDPDDLNDLNRTTYDACKGAVELLESQPELVKESRNLVKDLVKDTISRQAAKEAYCKKLCCAGAFCPDGMCKEVNETFDSIPPAQPEREKGEWILSGENTYTCSVCGKTIITNKDYIKEHKWCFGCGADMRGEQDEIN